MISKKLATCFHTFPFAILATLAVLALTALCGQVRAAAPLSWPQPETKEIVRTAQLLLRADGYRVSVDGKLGQQTRTQLVQFQRAHHLTADGVLGRQTWKVLIVTVKRGDKGDAVLAVQELVQNNLKEYTPYPPHIVIDGLYDSKTQQAVKTFQSAFSLKPDGIVGLVTWHYLLQGVTNVGFYD